MKDQKPYLAMQYALRRTVSAARMNFTHGGSLSMALFMAVESMIAILSENKPPDYFFL
jgi:hypothetical protein